MSSPKESNMTVCGFKTVPKDLFIPLFPIPDGAGCYGLYFDQRCVQGCQANQVMVRFSQGWKRGCCVCISYIGIHQVNGPVFNVFDSP